MLRMSGQAVAPPSNPMNSRRLTRPSIYDVRPDYQMIATGALCRMLHCD